MQFELRNTMVPVILLCYLRNMPKYVFELYALFRDRNDRTTKCRISQPFFDISDWNFQNVFIFDVFYNMYTVFLLNKYIVLKICQTVVLFSKFW